MFNNKAVRSALALLAVVGMAACAGNGAGAPSAQVNKSGEVQVLSETVQRASVETKFVDTATAEASDLYGRLSSIVGAEVMRETGTETSMIIDLRDASGASVLRFHAAEDFSGATSTTEGITATAAVTADGAMISEMNVRVGENLDVIFTFGPEQGKDNDQNQDQNQKQEEPKQDTPKQDTPKQDTPKQDTPKQDTPKQDSPKQDSPKQDSPKQDSPKQDSPKQDSPKQDSPKQDSPKQDSPKQDSPKQDSPKQDSPKQDSPKQDSPKQDSPKQDNPKQDTPKQGEAPKQG